MPDNEHDKLLAWDLTLVVLGNDPKQYRKDQCGAWMQWSQFNNYASEYGWVIATNRLNEFQAMQWQNVKETSFDVSHCVMMAEGSHNNHITDL